MAIFKKLYWLFVKKQILKFKLKGFYASYNSYAYNNCTFSEYNSLWSDAKIFNVKLGRFSYIAGGEVTNAQIGNFTSIGPGVKIGGFGKHPTTWVSTHPAFYSTRSQTKLYFSDKDYLMEYVPVIIGSDVWIGAKALILDGVTIGNGAIVGAGSIVTKDVLPYQVVVGVPSRHLRFRFPPEIIKILQENPWWEKDINFLKNHASLFRTEDVTQIVALLKYN